MDKGSDIGIYIHIPFCAKKCRYCDFSSFVGLESLWEPYCDALCRELELCSGTASGRNIVSIFIGGGTPSLIPYGHIERILESCRQHYRISPDAEITIESNPGTLDADKMKAYANAGVNRLSIGLQAYQDRLLAFLGRIHTAKQFDEAVLLAQSNGFFNINADIIFGIPNQTMEEWQATVSRILELEIPHVSCYSLKIEDDTEFGALREKGLLAEVDDSLDREMYHYAIDAFDNAGLKQYEISNFAKPRRQCRHNMNYWLRGEYLGFGSAAHSFIAGQRYANTPDVRRYMEGISAGIPELSERYAVSGEEALSESIILGLRLTEGIDIGYLSAKHGVDVESRYGDKIKLLLDRNLVESDGAMVRLTKKGLDYANQAFVEFI
jgi:oxygen-independent coproporphyrinogen-3 oxidase